MRFQVKHKAILELCGVVFIAGFWHGEVLAGQGAGCDGQLEKPGPLIVEFLERHICRDRSLGLHASQVVVTREAAGPRDDDGYLPILQIHGEALIAVVVTGQDGVGRPPAILHRPFEVAAQAVVVAVLPQ